LCCCVKINLGENVLREFSLGEMVLDKIDWV
jgi:hypothetical protein